MQMNHNTARDIYTNAYEHNACGEALQWLESFPPETPLEDLLKQSNERLPEWCYWYAKDVIKDRWPEAEDVIGTDTRYAFLYAKDVIKGPWPEAEDIIKTDAYYAFWYAKDVIRGPWPEAEDAIKTYAYFKERYEQELNCKL